MGWITRTDKELKELGYNLVIFRAVSYAGGPAKVAKECGYKSPESVKTWYRGKNRRPIPEQHIKTLCKMGGYKVTIGEIEAQLD